MTTDGVLVESTAAGHWAWVGLRLVPGVVESRAYADTDLPQWRVEAAQAEQAWLRAQWVTGHGERWELRYTNIIPGQPLSCVLLGRVHGRDLAEVRAVAVAFRNRLADLPLHVLAEPILDPDQLRAVLTPKPPGTLGCAELRKPLYWSWSTWPDVRRVCVAVSPLVPTGRSWAPIWSALARLTTPTTIGVYVEPCELTRSQVDGLNRLAAQYGAMAAGRWTDPPWKVWVPPDPFAVSVAANYVSAVQLYSGRSYRLRISVTADGPIPPSLVELLASTAGGAAVCWPPPAEVEASWRNVAALNQNWLDETYRQGAPAGELGEAERTLSGLADLGEVGAAFQFPHEAPDRVPLFSAADPSVTDVADDDQETIMAEEPVAPKRKRVFISYVREDLAEVNRLVRGLERAGYDVWVDTKHLRPGMRWKSVIRDEIGTGDYFIACFSPRYWKLESFMNEELIVAVERLRRMPRHRSWFIPIMFQECKIPDHPIGPDETIANTLQYVDFSLGWNAAFGQLTEVLG
ncbi:MAG TPA: toll/interleukin-1 receptor domain-containing protein [Pseudonocardiaceae bacterium]|nr:toll/interleukin-1 receptor domain-containing protein [Pseudonocardiaceae bacterium]